MNEPWVVTTTTQTQSVILTETAPASVVVIEQPVTQVIVTGKQGLPGPPGDSWLPDPAELANGRYITTLDGQYIDIPAPAGSGDMQTLIYDPQGRSTNAFLLDNQSGILDAGVFT
jgi:hypothetical protein